MSMLSFFFSSGYPAPRRCHSCVQIRNGEPSSMIVCNRCRKHFFRSSSKRAAAPDIWHSFLIPSQTHCRLTCVQQNKMMSDWCFFFFFSPISVADVFICGGYNGELILADLWKINLQTFQWSKLPAVMPEPAYFHCAAVTPVSALYKHTHTLEHTSVHQMWTSLSLYCPASSGWLHVHPWWRGEHPWEQENWLPV